TNALRTILVFGIPVATVYVTWFSYMSQNDLWSLFATRWHMTVTMIFGSFIAGASSEGGGAIAYPVMTLGFRIPPDVARNFGLAIQSIGMTAASLWIISRRIKVEWSYLLLAGGSGMVGVVVSSYLIAPYVVPAYAKMMFVSFWLSFGIALFSINHLRKRDTTDKLRLVSISQYAELLMIGFFGGVLSGVFGNGTDIATFAYVPLRYGLSEKIATPTSVIIMASNAVVGAGLHQFVIQDMQQQAIDFWLVCIPVVLIGAPLGAFVISRIDRLAIAFLLYSIILAQFVAAVMIVKPDGQLSLVFDC
ncbi:hypothetical protein LCGC14_3149320, partial [marine sediment metagenome]